MVLCLACGLPERNRQILTLRPKLVLAFVKFTPRVRLLNTHIHDHLHLLAVGKITDNSEHRSCSELVVLPLLSVVHVHSWVWRSLVAGVFGLNLKKVSEHWNA